MIEKHNLLDTAITKDFHERILTIDDTNDTAVLNKLPVANEYGYLDNSWLQDYSSYKIIDLGKVSSDYMTSLNETEYIIVMTLDSPSLDVLLFGASKNTPYNRALVYRFLIFNPNGYTLNWISNVEDSTIIWNTYSETAPTLDKNGTYVEFISTDDGKTWYGNSSARTAYDIVNNYYTKTESDDRFVNVTGDTMTGTLTIEGSHNSATSRGLIIKGDNQSHAFMVQDTSFNKGTAPDSYKTVEGVVTFANNGQLGSLYSYVTPQNKNSTVLRAHSTLNNDSNDNNYIAVSIESDGSKSTYAFTPATDDRTNNIATTEFVGNHFDTYIEHWLVPDMTSTTNAKILSNDGYDSVWVDYKKLRYVYYPSTSTTAITVPESYRADAVITEVYRDGVLLTESDDYVLDQSTGRITFKDIIESNEKIIVTTETAVKAHSNSVYDNVTITNSSASTPDVSDNSSKIATTAYVNNLISTLNIESGSGSGSSSGSISTVSPHFTGVPTAPTAAVGSNTNQIATTAFVNKAIEEYALNAFDSITITGVSTAPTANVGTNTEQIANTAFVTRAINNVIDNAPSSLNTLNKLTNAIGNDPSFASTINTSLAGKLNTGITTEGSGNAITNITEDSSGNVTAHKELTFSLSSHTHDNDYMPKLTDSIGSSNTPVYVNNSGSLEAFDISLGSDIKHVYFNNGSVTESTAMVGSDTSPIYINNGEFTASNATVGSNDTPIYFDNGVITSTNKNFSDYLPLAGGTLNGELTLNDGLIINDNDTETQLIFNSDSIQAVSGGNNSDLYLNEDGGAVHIGSQDNTEVTIENGVITASSFVGNIDGTSEKASMDSEGNVISTTYAPLESPVLTGTPTAPTPGAGDNSSKIATTAYVDSAINAYLDDINEFKISSVHYPNTGDTTITLTESQSIPNNVAKYAIAVYRDGIYLNSDVDYVFDHETNTFTFVQEFGLNEIVSILFTYMSTDTQPTIDIDIDEYEAGSNITFTENPITNKITISAANPDLSNYVTSADLSGYALANHTHSEYATHADVNNRFGIAVEKVNTLTSSSSITIDPTQGSIFTLTLDTNANINISSISNGYYTTNGSCITLMMPSNSYTVSWSSNITWIDGAAPDLSTGYNIITFITPNGGTTWYGDALQIES